VLHEPTRYKHTGPGEAVPMTLHGNVPTVEVTLDGRCKGTFIVDVGNASVLSVGAEQVQHCGLLGLKRKDVQHWVGGIGGAFTETVCRMDSLQLGPFCMNGPVVGLTTHHRGGAGSKEIQGNLGTTVLERFRCTFDYAHGTLWLEPGGASTRPSRSRAAGCGSRAGRGRDRARRGEGFARRRAGFKVRDVLRAVNGRRIERWTPAELDRLLKDGSPGRS
jgi:hypothetical protein